ncbi:TMV resistance protein N-like [Gossypium australe]|uniref:TMV resistance protein N-like n=1 Tax=Gossypium australe TaxID=47621 RepID=A0A5B6VSN0_9ROSI|nr:TMV resistance protein N-like [Gossypium australe]
MESLETFILSGCSKLLMFPKIDGKMEGLLELYLEETGIQQLPSSIEILEKFVILKTLNLSGLSFNGSKGPSSKLRRHLPSIFKVIQRGRTNSMASMLPLFFDLSSLAGLSLRDCNLCEGDIPSDIYCLSTLKQLDLSGNSFISILSSLTQISKLEFIGLVTCKRLKSLPELPRSLGSVSRIDCASPEIVANPPKVCNPVNNTWIFAANRYKLAKNIKALTFLKRTL